MKKQILVMCVLLLYSFGILAQNIATLNKTPSLQKTTQGGMSSLKAGVSQKSIAEQQNSSSSIAWLKKLGVNMNRAFVANAGQLGNISGVNNSDILYQIDDKSMNVSLTKTGLIYVIEKPVQVSDEEYEQYVKDNNISVENDRDKNDESSPKYIIKTEAVEMNWEGANANPEVVPENETSFYFNYYRPTEEDPKRVIGDVKGYTKIVYKNIYPFIDVEYTIHPEEGIKYSYILHPGADPSMIKMQYTGASVMINSDNNVELATDLGNITDHAPLTYKGYESSEKVVDSKFQLAGKSIVGFSLPNTAKIRETTVIDPWTVGPPFPANSYIPSDIAVDGSGNVLVYSYIPCVVNAFTGAITTYAKERIDKYNSAGVFQWTFDLAANAEYNAYQGDVAADPAGNVYVCDGIAVATGGTYNTIKINPAGTALLWGSATAGSSANNIYETWTITFNCDYSQFYQSGGGLYIAGTVYYNVSVEEPVNSTTGAEGTLLQRNNLGEVYDTYYAPNSLIYDLVADSNKNGSTTGNATAGAHNNLICHNIAGTQLFEVPTGYSSVDGDMKTPGSVGMNAIASSCLYLYTMNGAKLDRWDASTGAHYNQISIPGGTTTVGSINSGLLTDKCGDVYVGSNGKIYEYDPTLATLLNTITVPGVVIDMAWTNTNNTDIVACGGLTNTTTFLADVSVSACTLPNEVTVTPTQPTCTTSGSAIATATFCGSPYAYSWSNGQTTQTATGLSAGTYTVTVSSSISCPYSYVETGSVVINPPPSGPTVTVNSPTVCAGTAATLTGTGATTYSWSTGATTNPLTVSPTTTTTYTVTGTTAGCTGTAVGTVTVNPLPIVTVNSATVCAGTSATLTGVGATTYSWSTGATTNPITVSPAATTSYTVTGTDVNGCTGTAVATVTVAASLVVTVSPATICAGTSATLTASGATTYSWSDGETTNPITATPTTTTTYTVTGTTGGCTGSTTVVVTVNPLPTVTVNSPTVCAGTAATLTGTGATTYSWSTGATTNPLTVSPTTTTTYTVTGTTAGCTGTAVGTVTVNPLPIVTVNSATVCAGTSATLTGVGATTYSWSTGATTNPITVSPAATTSYTVTGTDVNGCTGTAVATVTVAASLVVTVSPATICAGTSATLTASGATTYSWSDGETTNPITATPTTTTTYTVTGTTGGCTGMATVMVTVDLLKASAGGFSATCFGTCNGYAVVIPSGGTAPYTYSWTPSGNTTANANNLCAGNYCIKLTDANGCNVDTCVTVSQPTILALNTTTTTANCSQANGSTSVNATGGTGTYTYLWAPSGQTTATATAITAGTYTVTVTDGNSCTQTATAVVPNAPGVVASIASSTNDGCFGTCDGTATSLATSGTAPYNYSWNAVPAQTTAEATGLCAGTYTVSITDATGCSNTASVTITQPTQITVSPSAATTICIGQSTILSANAAGGTPAYTYSWNNIYNGQDYTVSPTTTPTTYTVVVTDADGCISAPQTVVVNLNPPLAVIAKNDTSLCLGGHASLSAMGSGGNGTYNYAWQPGALSGSPISVTPNTTTIYTVTVTDNCGTPPATNTVTVTVNPLPVVSFSADTVSGCYPLCVTFTNLSTPASASATWEFGDGNTANTIATASNCYQIPNSYNVTLTVTDNLGCSNSTTLNDMITVYPHPTANFSMSPQPATIMNPTVFFKDLSTGTVNQWEWNLGDVPNSSSNLQNPQYTYPDTGYYNVQLIVTNNFGCTDSITKTVYIEGQFVIYVPNAFTPNGDGINDTFYPKGTGIDPNNYQMYIFDRWGNMLFYTTSLNQGWNGKVEGDSQLVQEDVYVWKIICKDFLGNNHQYIGHVSVVR